MLKSPLRIGVLASGAGTTLQAVIDACIGGRLPATIAVVITNNSQSGAVARAQRHSIPWVHLSSKTHRDPRRLDDAIRDTLTRADVNFVLLAGYMKKLGPNTLRAFSRRIVNTHPALLPRHSGQGMYGSRVHAAVLASGDTVTGVSAHVADAEYDTGRVLEQREVPVQPGDDVRSLSERVQRCEREFIVDVLGRIADGTITL